MDALILFGGMLGALIGVFGRRSVAARRTGAVLIGLDVLRRAAKLPHVSCRWGPGWDTDRGGVGPTDECLSVLLDSSPSPRHHLFFEEAEVGRCNLLYPKLENVQCDGVHRCQ